MTLDPAARSWRATAWLALPVLLALVLRLGFVAATPDYNPVVHDDTAYNHLACVVSQNGSYPHYPDAHHDATAYRPPVYPYFLAGIYSLTGCDPQAHPSTRTAWPRIAGSIIGVLAVAMIAALGARWWGRRAGFVAGMLAAVFGPAIVIGAQLLSEQLFTALILASIVAVMRVRRGHEPLLWAVVAGVAAGLATLTRTNGALIVPALAAGAWVARPRWSRRALGPPLAVLLAAALTVAPWTIRNLHEVHRFVPVSDEAGGTLAGTYNDVARHDPDLPASWHKPEEAPENRAFFRDARRRQLPEVAMQAHLEHRAIAYARKHPGYVAEVGWWNMLRLTGAISHAQLLADARSLSLPEWPIRLAWSTSEFALLLALLGVVSGAARRSPRFVWIGAALLLASTVFVNAESLRFQVPFGAFECLLGGAGVAWLFSASTRTRRAA